MEDIKALNYIQNVLKEMPSAWLKLTTHRLDIYNEGMAKTEFLSHFEQLFESNNFSKDALNNLPTAFDYIRLGHPLSCILEWGIAQTNQLEADHVLCFSSKTTPILAVLRKNLLTKKKTLIAYKGSLPACFDAESLKTVYGYQFELLQVEKADEIPAFEGSIVFVNESDKIGSIELIPQMDFYVSMHQQLGSIICVNGDKNASYISEIQHVRRRETISMTPSNTLCALENLVSGKPFPTNSGERTKDKAAVVAAIQKVSGTTTDALVGSSGLSIQYAIMMGLVDHALQAHSGKAIKFIVPPNCYGGTNDQARRVAACIDNVEVVDLPVDGDANMVQSIDSVLDQIAEKDAVPYIIAEIPTNPRVEVPDLIRLKEVLAKERKTAKDEEAIAPIFILDQTFCPNVHFLGEGEILSTVKTISYVSGSKFPSGGKCTAGYCVANQKASAVLGKIENHLMLCDNEATDLQLSILANQMPSMNERIESAYKNTREFVNFIRETLPSAKINFVSEDLAKQGFTPSVFSLDLPTKGETDQEREAYKRELNLKLINMMIDEIPNESKYCVSYGQLQGCYWTIPATSTQGTTKEDDKDYIARVSLSPNMDLSHHKKVFADFVAQI